MKTKTLIVTLFVIIRITSYGQAPNPVWLKGGGGSGYDYGSSVEADALGNVFVAGEFYSDTMRCGSLYILNNSTGSPDIFITKYDPLGNVLWIRGAAGLNSKTVKGINVDINGNVLLVGTFGSPAITFGSITLSNPAYTTSTAIFVVKYDTYGNVLWAKTARGYGQEVNSDSYGNVIVTGGFNSATTFFGSDTLVHSPTLYLPNFYLVKYDSVGNLVWLRGVEGSPSSNNIGEGLSVDNAGNIYVAGNFNVKIYFGSDTLTSLGSSDIFFVKYTASGNVDWAKRAGCLGIQATVATCVAADNLGNIFVSGKFMSDSITFESTLLMNTSSGYSDIFLAKYDTLGNLIWAKSNGGAFHEYGIGLAVDSQNNALLTGTFSSNTLTFGTTTLTNLGSWGGYIAKYANSGNIIWAQKLNVYTVNQCYITTDINDNPILSGSFQNTFISGTDTLFHSGFSDDMFVIKLSAPAKVVWPGDANNNYLVDNNDLLEVGLFYGQAGITRTVTGNLWQADTSLDWGINEFSGADIKHADCNGDGIINDNDTLAINLNFSLTHTFAPTVNDERSTNPVLYFTTASGTYPPGSWINVDIMAGTSALPANNLYGIAFDLQYDALFVQPGTESLIYPNSWFANPGTDAIKLGVVDAVASTAYAAETRIDQTNRDGFGKIATFRFQAKSSISSLSNMNFSYSGYVANDSAGNNILFNPQSYSIVIDPLATAIEEAAGDDGIEIFPNPNNGNFAIVFTSAERSDYSLKVINVLGQVVHQEHLPDFTGTYSKSLSLDKSGKGVYTITLSNDKNEVVKKIIVY